MSLRLDGPSAAIRALAPAGLEPAYLAVTALGGTTTLLFGLSFLYWLGWRREAATVVSYGFVGLATVLALKAWFALPRPPESIALIATDGYGFPSGHAVAAVVVYGGLALERDWIDDPSMATATATLVAAVGLSRVVLGVHYLGDVIAGFAVGAVVLAVTSAVAREDPARGFLLGAVVAVPAIALTGTGLRAIGALGACVGGVVGVRYADFSALIGSRAERAILVVVGTVFVLVVDASGALLAGVHLVAWLDDVVLVAGVLALPTVLAESGVAATSSRFVER